MSGLEELKSFPFTQWGGIMLAAQPRLSSYMESLLCDHSGYVRAALAANPKIADVTVGKLMQFIDAAPGLVKNPSIHLGTQKELVYRALEILAYALENEKLVQVVWDGIAKFLRDTFPKMLALHPHIDPKKFSLTVGDYENNFYYRLVTEALNPETPADRLQYLHDNYGCIVDDAIVKNPSTPPDILLDFVARLGAEILSHPAITEEHIQSLADPSTAPAILWQVAAYEKTPTDILEQLSTHEHPIVRFCVAINPSTPQHVCERLAQDKDDDVRIAATYWNEIFVKPRYKEYEEEEMEEK